MPSLYLGCSFVHVSSAGQSASVVHTVPPPLIVMITPSSVHAPGHVKGASRLSDPPRIIGMSPKSWKNSMSIVLSPELWHASGIWLAPATIDANVTLTGPRMSRR